MLAVRLAVLAALVVWLGGMAVLTFVVAPAAAPGLQMAILERFFPVAWGCGAVMLVGLLVLKFVGPPPAGFVPRLGLAAAMLAGAVYTGVPVTREAARVNAGLRDAGAPGRERLDALHRQASTALTLNLGLGLLSLFWYARE